MSEDEKDNSQNKINNNNTTTNNKNNITNSNNNKNEEKSESSFVQNSRSNSQKSSNKSYSSPLSHRSSRSKYSRSPSRSNSYSSSSYSRSRSREKRKKFDIPKIFVAKLGPRVSKRDLEKEFRNFGEIRDLNLKRGYAFIEYYNKIDAKNAIKGLNNQKLFGQQQRIVVEPANGSKRERRRERDRRRDYRRSRSRSLSRSRYRDRDYYYRRRPGPKKTDVCYNCGKEGHWANECTFQRKER